MTAEADFLPTAAHAPGAPDSAGHPRCESCGYRYPCPTLRMAAPDQTDEEAEVIGLVDVGWSVWRRLPVFEQARPRVGGIVVDWAETEEGHRRFRCLDWFHGQPVWHPVLSTEIDPRDCALPNASILRSQARRLAREFAGKKGALSSWDVDLIRTAAALVTRVA